MITITFNGKTLKQWFNNKIKEHFCSKNIKPGKILVVWRDVDDEIYGWTVSADEEYDLIKIAQMIAVTKQKKLIHIIAGKEMILDGKS